MASYKNQHFVPRCYLKPFSLDGEGLAINLYNIDRRVGIQNAPVKNQCSASYFYGEDLRLERLLQKSENWYAQTLRDMHIPNYILTEEGKSALRHFCFLQHCRTEATARRAAMFVWEMVDVAWSGDAPPDWALTMRESVLESMRTFATSFHAIDDLKVCLIRNTTHKPLVSSDDPAVLTNRWYCQNPKAKGLSGGVESAGALFFFPLTPQVMCVIYDGDVYSMPSQGGWMIADTVSDIDAFNQHQFLGCLANIYFADWAHQPLVALAFEEVATRRPPVRHEVITAVLDREDNRGKSYRVVPRSELSEEGEALIHVKSIRPEPIRWPSMIKWRHKPRIYSNDSGTGFVRRSRADQGVGYRRIP